MLRDVTHGKRHSNLHVPSTIAIIEVGQQKLLIARDSSRAGHGTPRLEEGTPDGYRKSAFLSPDRERLVVTAAPVRSHGGVSTYIADLDGNALVAAHPGSFVSWLPDSSGVLVYLSEFQNKDGKKIHVLNNDGKYTDLGLPVWTYSADLSTDGAIAYSLANPYTDASNLWVRRGDGRDSLVVQGNDEIFAWVRWSPNGDKLAFLRSKIGAATSGEARQLWVVNPDGSGATKVAESVLWAYPPVWSPDGKRLLIAIEESGGGDSIAVDYETLESNIWEYDIASQVLRKLTSFEHARALQPSYSGDGSSVVFVADQSGADEVWRIRGGKLEQLTNDGTPKQYPILP